MIEAGIVLFVFAVAYTALCRLNKFSETIKDQRVVILEQSLKINGLKDRLKKPIKASQPKIQKPLIPTLEEIQKLEFERVRKEKEKIRKGVEECVRHFSDVIRIRASTQKIKINIERYKNSCGEPYTIWSILIQNFEEIKAIFEEKGWLFEIDGKNLYIQPLHKIERKVYR